MIHLNLSCIYLPSQKVHQGGCYWLNTVLLTHADLLTYSTSIVSKQRVESFFSLGISISKIVELSPGLPIVRAFSQLMEEWEYVHSGTTMQSVKFVMAKNSTCIYPQLSPIEGFSDLARPSVYKFNNAVVYEHLRLPHIPFELDYLEVFTVLCTELSKLYEKLIHEECYSNQVIYDAIVRLDTRVKHHIINLVSKEVTDASAAKMKAGTRTLRSLAGIFLPKSFGGGSSASSSNLAKASGAPPVPPVVVPSPSTGGIAAGVSGQSSAAPSTVPSPTSTTASISGLPSPPLPHTASSDSSAAASAVRTENPIQGSKRLSRRDSGEEAEGEEVQQEQESQL